MVKKKFFLWFAIISSLLICSCSSKRSGAPEILIFSKTAGFVHNSIPEGIAAIQKLGEENNFKVDTTSNANYFTPENLDKYAAVVFLNTTGDVFEFEQEVTFERYIQAGGSYVGVHAAADTEYGWTWYGRLAGAYFKSHPVIQEADFIVEDKSFIATSFLPDSIWTRVDELYNYKDINPKINVVLTIDENSYEGGENSEFHPMAWYHEYDGGRAFYTALGHTKESYQEELFLQHLLGGIQYAIGENKKLNYKIARTEIPPDGSRFSKYQLVGGEFTEPTEMAILPNEDILVAQRRGELLMYKQKTGELSQVGFLDVYHNTGIRDVNAEEGFMGLQKDPNFAENNWIYTYYSPTGDESVNRLSRFKFFDDTLQMSSEQVILDVASDRQICCHTGGSITFGPGGLLYLSTGDNTTPFDEADADYVNDGYAPLNDLPGKRQYDARRTSANTNDLRGKILRIKVNYDGTYDIPDGNLFPVGTDKTRPEIYTMGHRNPYRISVDPKNGFVYWGDIGPDSREDKMDTRGPMGYDEMNVAREPGNFGWPLFIADNKAYRKYNYATGESGDFFDPEEPINNSNNNTGLTKLPPARPAYIFYNYDASTIFSGIASGGRNAMAGPVFYSDLYDSEDELPEHYDGKVIIYDWMRGWMKAVDFYENGELKTMEPFAESVELNNLIDMEMGPTGKIFLLEYGSGWFSQNDDSGLSYLKYNEGNQPPSISNFTADVTSGKTPLTINLEVNANDLEEGGLTYLWHFGDGSSEESSDPKMDHVYEEEGSYDAMVEVIDNKNMVVKSELIKIVCGNTRPEVSINLDGVNSSFFIPGIPIDYKVDVTDIEDGANLDSSKISVNVEYMEGYDEAGLSMGHQEASPTATGRALTLTMTCKTCHKENGASIGPSYIEVAEKYTDNEDAINYLENQMINGSSGIWGANVMPSNAELKSDEANKIAKYILSLSGKQNTSNSLPPEGSITPDKNKEGKVMVITASYTDNGAPGTIPLTGVQRILLKTNEISMQNAADIIAFNPIEYGEMNLLIMPRNGGSFAFEDLDLTGVAQVDITAGWQSSPSKSISLEMRLNAPDGELIGKGTMPKPDKNSEVGTISIKLNQKLNEKAEKVYFLYNPGDNEKLGRLTFVALVAAKFSS